MAINFPASPSTNDTHTENAITWIFNGTSWNAQGDQVTAASIGLGNVDNTADANKPVSTAQQAAIDAEITIAKDASFVFVGDSITAGAGGQTDTAWSTTIQTLSNFTGRGTFTNKAVSGYKKADMVADYAAEVEPLKPGAGETVYLLGMIGINDVASSSLTTANVATWFAELETYWTTAKADGFKIVWSTMTTRNGIEPVINTVSRLMLASDIPDIIIDGNQLLPNAKDTRYYSGDKLHLTELGGRILAEAINDKMTSGAGRTKDTEWRRTQDAVMAGDYIAVKPASKQVSIGDDLDGNSALLLLNGTNARVTFSRGDNTQLTTGSVGMTGSSGAGAYGSISHETLITAQEARHIAFGVSVTGTQAVRWRLESNGVWRSSRTTSTTDYSQAGSAQFGLAAASGYHVIGSIRNDLLMVAPSGNSIIFGTEEGTSTQTTRMRIKADGSMKLNEGPEIHTGSGTPEASVSAPVGSTYHRTDGGAGTSFYVKESGTGNTGWVAK
jgi:hypothetical protein